MMKPKTLAFLALLLVLVLYGSVTAGPRNPQWGDPDVVEGIRARGTVTAVQVQNAPSTPIIINIPILGRIVLLRQEQRVQLYRITERLPAAVRKNLRSR